MLDPLSNVDRLVSILRQRLADRSRLVGKKFSPKRRQEATGARSLVEALAEIDQIDERILGRALIQNVLAEHFGSAALNDAKFQRLVDQVTEALHRDPVLSDLVRRVVDDLRTAAR